MPVNERLRPMQRAMVFAHAFEVATIRLDLFEPVARGIVTVGAAAHREGTIDAAQREFGFVAAIAPAGDHAVPCDAFGRTRRRRETQVEIAALRGELA